MQNVSNDFKNQLTQPKTIDAKILIGNEVITSDDINNINRTFNSSLFKTVAKSVNIDSNVPIEKNTETEPQFGVYIGNGFEYVSLGTYKAKDEPILNKDTNSYQTTAYDKIVDSMVDYALTDADITFPCTVRQLFVAIFTKLNWNTNGIPTTFTNSTSTIEEDVYSRANMTYRDVLDELCTISCMFLIDNGNPTLINRKPVMLPSEYQQVEYIQNSGTQYIDTGYIPNYTNGFKVEFKYQPTNTTQRGCLFSNYNVNNHISYELNGSGHERIYINEGQLDKVSDGFYTTGINTSNLQVTSTTTTQVVNGVTTTSSYSVTGSSAASALLFVDRMYRYGTFNNYIKLYSCKIYEGNTLVRNFVPCYRKSDNVIGLYDLVNNVFYTNAGTGTFTKGNNVGETINEEYMSDTSVEIKNRVFFNSLVFSRASDSDNIFRKDDDSIDANGLHEFKVRDLQILSLNWRDNFIDEMWNYIKDFQYYAYDVNTVGISYLDPIDKFCLSTFGDVYPTLLLNSDLSIGNGVNEKIYANEPVESATEYKYADTTDRKINQAYLIVDKQNSQIQALTQTTSNLSSTEATHYQEMLSKMDDKASISDIETVTSQVNSLQTDTYSKTEIKTILEGVNDLGIKVSYVSTTSATFNEDGMTYNKSGADTSSTINETGLTVNDKANNELLFAGFDNATQQALVRVANLYLTQFLGLDVWRVEIINDSTNGKGLGFFYIG